MLGSDATFGGRRLYYGEHGSFDIYDYNYASEQGFIPEGYKVFWGFEDERLFAWAKQLLPGIAASGEPFNLTMLTVDTHFEDGWVCDLCGDEFGDDQYANVMACSSRQVSEFVTWLSQQDFWENTTVIISGDHTTMDKDFCENVPSTFQRRTLVSVINGAAEPEDPEATRTYSTLDLFPTTLAALGVKVQGDRLGLGTNLYGTRPTIVEQYGLDACRNALSGPSDFLASQGEIVVGERNLELAAKNAKLKAQVEEDGTVSFILSDVSISTSYVLDAKVRILDDRTQGEQAISMEIVPVEDHPQWFWCRANTDYREEDLQHLTATALLTTNGCEDYPICEGFSIDEGQ
jgi:phosphoglycerol transferase